MTSTARTFLGRLDAWTLWAFNPPAALRTRRAREQHAH